MHPLVPTAFAFALGFTLASALFTIVRYIAGRRGAPVSGHLSTHFNTKRRFGSSRVYFSLPVIDDGSRKVLLLTGNECAVAFRRAQQNPEDCPNPAKFHPFWI